MSAMKRFNSIIYAAFAAVAVLGGCAKETISEQASSVESGKYHIAFTAQKADDEVLVKASISVDDNKVINWSVGDSISVFDGAGNNCKFILTEGAGTPKGKFEGEVSVLASSYSVLYPYQKNPTITLDYGDISGVFLKGDQTAVKGSFDPEAGLMAARSREGNTVSFKNIVGYVKFECGFDCKELFLSSNNGSVGIAGREDIVFYNGEPQCAIIGGRRAVCLSGSIEAGAAYYFALLPSTNYNTMDKGFTLTFTTTDGKEYVKSTDKPFTVKRGVVTDLGTLDKGNTELVAPYITFSADSDQTFAFAKRFDVPIDISLFEYSVNGGTWTTMSADTLTFGGAGGDLRLRGKSPEGTATGVGNAYVVKFGNPDVKVECNGDIRTLIDYENWASADTRKACFATLFFDAIALVSAPELPITDLAAGCYSNMFYGTSITDAPMLPATVLPDNCYTNMFMFCRQLKSSPDLMATAVGYAAYMNMFHGCTALKKAPGIHATDFIGSNNCKSMFQGCTALEEGPSVLCSEFLTPNCYDHMFESCSSLKKAPVIKAVKLGVGDSHCSGMFYDCTSLEEVQDVLFAEDTQLGPNSCSYMFKGCTNLKKAPSLPSLNLSDNCYRAMFLGCTSLTDVPESLPAMTLKEMCYYEMFYGCTNMQKAPKLPAETLVKDCYGHMLRECSSLTEVWLYAQTDLAMGLSRYTFYDCSSTGVTVYISNRRDYDGIWSYIGHPDWTYICIETGEVL